MSVNRYVIAGLKVEMEVRYDFLKSRSEKYLCEFLGNADMVISWAEDKMQLLREKSPDLSEGEREYIYTAIQFYNKLIKFNGFMLHSSSLCYKDKSYLFSADSGTGKSTHVGLWTKYLGDSIEIINDDKPAIRLIDGVFYAMGTPWSGKTVLNSDIAVPVGAVALLYRSEQNVITPAETNDIVVSILKQTVLPRVNTKADVLFELLDKFVRSVKVFRFGCDMSEDAVKTSFEAMTGEKYIKRT